MTEGPTPIGWERVEADDEVAELLELLHPAIGMRALEDLYVAPAQGVTGAILALSGAMLEVRSLGNAVARVEVVAGSGLGCSALFQLAQLAGKVEPLEE